MPVWSPDGTQIVFAAAGRGAPPNLYQKALNGSGPELLLKSSFNSQPTDWSRDGRYIVYASLIKTNWDLWFLPMTGAETDRKPVRYIESEDNEHQGRLSPDGRWLAYVSDESGDRNEVYVQSFPTSGDKKRISVGGGTEPKWRGDGRELFYVTADGRLMAVSVTPGATLEFAVPEELFRIRIVRQVLGVSGSYASTQDGQRFLVNTLTEESNSVPTKIVLNWPAALRR